MLRFTFASSSDQKSSSEREASSQGGLRIVLMVERRHRKLSSARYYIKSMMGNTAEFRRIKLKSGEKINGWFAEWRKEASKTLAEKLFLLKLSIVYF